MNLYLLELFGKWINFMMVSFLAVFGFLEPNQVYFEVENMNSQKSFMVDYQIEPYEIEHIYKSNMPAGKEQVVESGQEKVVAVFDGAPVVLQEKENKVKKVGTGEPGKYYGNLTGYGADCRGCDGQGNLACFNANHNLVDDGKYYHDDEYGEVRIVAAPSQTLANGKTFSCGTIVTISFEDQSIKAIVLDRGIALENSFEEDVILFDLAFVSEQEELSDIYAITRQDGSVQFEVKRWGF